MKIAKTKTLLFPALFILISLLSATGSMAQTNTGKVSKALPQNISNRIAKADKIIKKGDKILSEADPYVEQADKLKEDGKIRKYKKVNSKVNKIKVKAASYFKDGYRKKAKALLKALNEAYKVNPQLASRIKEIELNSEKKIKSAKKLYRKAGNMSTDDKAVDFYETGHKNYIEAIDILTDGLALVYKNNNRNNEDIKETITPNKEDSVTEQTIMTEQEEPEPIQANTTTTTVNTTETIVQEAAPQATTAAVATTAAATTAVAITETEEAIQSTETEPETESPVETAVEEQDTELKNEDTESKTNVENKKNGDVFFSIQFIADKKPIPEDLLKTKYSGNLEVLEMVADGWYRYSAGKFTNIEDAKAAMKSEGIKGFIVAYQKDKRITISEALKLLNE
ncbi:MAG: hypothetical protein GXO47_11685 [Chlorobi bacterium]|nr:hypothetical protein [Chlorobiota bacterium]